MADKDDQTGRAEAEVRIWYARLAADDTQIEALRGILDTGERERAARFAFDRDRRRFIVSHGILRRILAERLGRDPAGLVFALGAHGKPRLPGAGDIHFNMSHAGEYALYAVREGGPVGVDVARIRADAASELADSRFLSAREVQALRWTPEAGRTRAFFTIWTRKEAVIKATGQGMSAPLHDITVWKGRESSPIRVSAAGADWRVVDLQAPDGYAAAVAAPAGRWRTGTLGWWEL